MTGMHNSGLLETDPKIRGTRPSWDSGAGGGNYRDGQVELALDLVG
jgi:hypothetical protein